MQKTVQSLFKSLPKVSLLVLALALAACDSQDEAILDAETTKYVSEQALSTAGCRFTNIEMQSSTTQVYQTTLLACSDSNVQTELEAQKTSIDAFIRGVDSQKTNLDIEATILMRLSEKRKMAAARFVALDLSIENLQIGSASATSLDTKKSLVLNEELHLTQIDRKSVV